jgi:hypothetical protein
MEEIKGNIRIESASRSQLQKMPLFNYGKNQEQKK